MGNVRRLLAAASVAAISAAAGPGVPAFADANNGYRHVYGWDFEVPEQVSEGWVPGAGTLIARVVDSANPDNHVLRITSYTLAGQFFGAFQDDAQADTSLAAGQWMTAWARTPTTGQPSPNNRAFCVYFGSYNCGSMTLAGSSQAGKWVRYAIQNTGPITTNNLAVALSATATTASPNNWVEWDNIRIWPPGETPQPTADPSTTAGPTTTTTTAPASTTSTTSAPTTAGIQKVSLDDQQGQALVLGAGFVALVAGAKVVQLLVRGKA